MSSSWERGSIASNHLRDGGQVFLLVNPDRVVGPSYICSWCALFQKRQSVIIDISSQVAELLHGCTPVPLVCALVPWVENLPSLHSGISVSSSLLGSGCEAPFASSSGFSIPCADVCFEQKMSRSVASTTCESWPLCDAKVYNLTSSNSYWLVLKCHPRGG